MDGVKSEMFPGFPAGKDNVVRAWESNIFRWVQTKDAVSSDVWVSFKRDKTAWDVAGCSVRGLELDQKVQEVFIPEIKWTHRNLGNKSRYGIKNGRVYWEMEDGQVRLSAYVVADLSDPRQFESLEPQGVKHDSDKPQTNLLPPKALLGVSEVLTYGAEKYSPDNWRKFDDIPTRYLAAALRHLFLHMGGERNDPESGLSHIDHAAASLLFISEDLKLKESE